MCSTSARRTWKPVHCVTAITSTARALRARGFGLVDAARAALTAADAVAGAAETGGTVFRCRLVRALPRLRAAPAQRA
ncbi:hypothetical protein G6F32_016353 [Rhizopus arrhizus]|nr:hypothetical protein G6F32_016353 [Rhizopus arrhizus]